MEILLLSTENDTWSLGLRSISAVLTAAGHRPRLVFMPTNERYYSEKILNDLALLASHTDIIGVSSLARGSEKAKQVIEFLHSKKKLIVWGGVHPSLNPEECVNWADIVCRGEGEGMMLELVERLSREDDWRNIENIAYKENGTLKMNDLRPVIADLDDLPLPDFSFKEEFHLSKKGFEKVTTLPGLKKGAPIIFNSSRGCAFHCTYCCNVKLKGLFPVNGRYVRRMSVSRLIEHAQKLRTIFPEGKYIYFIDEDFAARPVKELAQFSLEYPQKVGLPFECLAHPARINHQRMDLLNKAGLFRINLGVESGSERTKREIFDRHVSNEVVKQATQIIHNYPNIMPYYFFIIANPYEEQKDVLATAQLITSFPGHCTIKTYNLVFFPGSYIYERAVQDGLIEGKHDCGYELDFLGGLNYKDHAWKNKNLYLNGIIFLMDGLNTRNFIGSLPRFLVRWLLQPRQIDFFEKHTSAIKLMISIKFFINSVLHTGARLIKKIIGNPTVIYNLGYHVRNIVLRFSIGKLTKAVSIRNVDMDR